MAPSARTASNCFTEFEMTKQELASICDHCFSILTTWSHCKLSFQTIFFLKKGKPLWKLALVWPAYFISRARSLGLSCTHIMLVSLIVMWWEKIWKLLWLNTAEFFIVIERKTGENKTFKFSSAENLSCLENLSNQCFHVSNVFVCRGIMEI